MSKSAPSPLRIGAALIFALGCIALFLFLWRAFGGAVPLDPKGYRFHARFAEATQLVTQADVRISGVPVGKVVVLEESRGRTKATIELDEEYAPLPSDARAILRQKTLLGETYVELTPGSQRARPIPDGGTLSTTRIRATTELDEILRVFDPRTRQDLQRLMATWSESLEGRGGDISQIVANAAPTLGAGTDLLEILDSQDRAVRRLVRDSGRVFASIGARDADIGRLIRASDAVLETTANRNAKLAEVTRVLPTFLRELRPTMTEAQRTAVVARPVLAALRPVAPLLKPTLRDVRRTAPDLRALLADLDPLIRASRRGLPATDDVIDAARPLVDTLYPVGRELVPTVDYLGAYKTDLTNAFANIAASTSAGAPDPTTGSLQRYVRLTIPINNEVLGVHAKRAPSNRFNPYIKPEGLREFPKGLESFSCAQTNNGGILPPLLGSAGPCRQQGNNPVLGNATQYPRLQRDGP